MTLVYERERLWFWVCPSCRWFEGAYKRHAEARKDANRHECRGEFK